MIEWCVWYADGSVYSSRDFEWSEIPDDGVQFVKVKESEQYQPGYHYCRILNGKDWYWLDGEIKGINSDSWDGWLPKPEGIPEEMIKRGTGMDRAAFEALDKEVDQLWR